MIFDSQNELTQNSLYDISRTMRMPICILIEVSEYMELYNTDVIFSIQNLFKSIQERKTLLMSADMCIMSVHKQPTVSRDFGPIRGEMTIELELEFDDEETTQCDVEKGLEAAIVKLRQRSKEYRIRNLNQYTPFLIVVGSGKAQKGPNFDRVSDELHTLGKSGQLYTIPILVGDGTPGIMKEISYDGKYYSGTIDQMREIFDLILQSMQSLSESTANAFESLVSQAEEWKYFERE